MSARQEILNRLRGRERAVTLPPPWRSRREFPSLEERFRHSLEAVYGQVLRAGSQQEALSQAAQLLEQMGVRKIVINHEPPLEGLVAHLAGMEWHIAAQDAGVCRDCGQSWRWLCADSDAGLSSADAALAETGSLIISSGPGKSRLTTLLPPVHLALLPRSRLTTDLFTWLAALRRQQDAPLRLPANAVLVSGPSKTADIEQTMSVGVHGPKRLIVILYPD